MDNRKRKRPNGSNSSNSNRTKGKRKKKKRINYRVIFALITGICLVGIAIGVLNLGLKSMLIASNTKKLYTLNEEKASIESIVNNLDKELTTSKNRIEEIKNIVSLGSANDLFHFSNYDTEQVEDTTEEGENND